MEEEKLHKICGFEEGCLSLKKHVPEFIVSLPFSMMRILGELLKEMQKGFPELRGYQTDSIPNVIRYHFNFDKNPEIREKALERIKDFFIERGFHIISYEVFLKMIERYLGIY